MIVEEFEVGKDYYTYFYFPSMICTKLLYACLLVFTTDKPYTVPIVTSIMNLILCNKYTVSYIVSTRPYVHLSDMIIMLFEICIEIIFLFFPVVYSVDAISNIILDSLTLGVLCFGMLILQIKAYLDVKDPKDLTPVSEGKKQTAKVISNNYVPQESSRDGILNMKSDEIEISKDFKNIDKEQIDDKNLTDKKNSVIFGDWSSEDPVFPIISGQITDDQQRGNKDKTPEIKRIPSRESNKILDFGGKVKSEKNVYNTYRNPNDKPNGGKDALLATQAYDDIGRARQNDGQTLKDLKDIDSISNYLEGKKREDKVVPVKDIEKNQRVDLNKFTVKSRFSFN